MNPPVAVTATVPLAGLVVSVYVNGSPLASVALTVPVTTPVEAFGIPTAVLGTGTALTGLIVTVTA